jgi:uncharacterized protein YwgA
MMYIAKALGYPVNEDFVWGNYGVYSSELQWELDALVKQKMLTEQDVGQFGQPAEYEYSLGKEGISFLRRADLLAARSEELLPCPAPGCDDPVSAIGNNELDALVSFLSTLNTKSVRDLELWSSILYLEQSESDEESLIAFLRYLKPQYTEDETRKGLTEVRNIRAHSFESIRHAHSDGDPAE